MTQQQKPQQHLEIENRYLIKPNPEAISALPKKFIKQVYLAAGPHPEHVSRVRIVNDSKAEISRKTGTVGMVRGEEPAKLFDLNVAMNLYEHATVRIEKIRHEYQGWEIDVFLDRHRGLVLAEYERKSVDDPIPPFPEQFGTVVREVTDEVSNFMLASMHHPMADRICKRIVLTGGPCSGKSTAVRAIRQKHDGVAHCVQEVATTVMDMARIFPFGRGANNANSENFQRTIASVQRALEDGADFDAASNDRKVVVLDRGIADGGAYVSGLHELESIIGMSRSSIYSRYDLVLYFEMPNRDIYEKFSAENPKRYEKDYQEACMRGNRAADAWSGHPRFVTVRDAATWEEKLDEALRNLHSYL